VDALAARVIETAAAWIAQARKLTGANARQLPNPEIRFDLRGAAAGQTVFVRKTRHCVIRINAALLAAHPREMIAQTVPHEVAHVAVYRLHGSRAKPHGAQWQALMRAFGLAPEPCHTLPVTPARRLKRFRYACACAEPAWLTSIRHKRAQRGTIYLCRRCGQRLRRSNTVYTGLQKQRQKQSAQ
jgi:SprT protein